MERMILMMMIIVIIILFDFTNLILGFPITTSKIPVRWGHSATLIGSDIYFIGGRTEDNVFITELIKLDVSKPFTISTPKWVELDSTGVPKTVGHSAIGGGLNHDQIIIFGGGVDDPVSVTTNGLRIYDTTDGRWDVPSLNSGPSRRYEHTAVMNPSGEMLIYGGLMDELTGDPNKILTFELWGLNVNTLDSWKPHPSTDDSPGRRMFHTASMIDNKMIVIGGITENVPKQMNEIYVYDSDESAWDLHLATGNVPIPRREHSAVVLNQNIIVYGGSDATNTILYGDVAVLDTDTWTWTLPTTTNNPPNRRSHTATLVGSNMIVAFGRTLDTIDSNIYVLNVSNWTWSNEYVPMPLPSDDFTPMTNVTNPNPSPSPDGDEHDANQMNCLPLIIALSVIGGLIVIGIILFIMYRFHYKRKVDSGEYLVAVPYESNPNPTTPEMAHTRTNNIKRSRCPSFLCLGKGNKHDSTEILNAPSPSTGPPTPHTTHTTHTRTNSEDIPSGRQTRVRFSGNTFHRYDAGTDDHDNIASTSGTSGISGVGTNGNNGTGGTGDPRPSLDSLEDIQSISGESFVTTKQELFVVNPDKDRDT